MDARFIVDKQPVETTALPVSKKADDGKLIASEKIWISKFFQTFLWRLRGISSVYRRKNLEMLFFRELHSRGPLRPRTNIIVAFAPSVNVLFWGSQRAAARAPRPRPLLYGNGGAAAAQAASTRQDGRHYNPSSREPSADEGFASSKSIDNPSSVTRIGLDSVNNAFQVQGVGA